MPRQCMVVCGDVDYVVCGAEIGGGDGGEGMIGVWC